MTPTPTSGLRLVLDVRESRLADALKTLDVPFTLAPLDVGDFLIQNEEGEPLLVAERKSHADLAASNVDGRYREQRARLMAVRGSGVTVLYILEGGSLDNTLKRITTRLMLRYGMPVLATSSLADTANWCRILLSQLSDDPTVFQTEAGMNSAMTGFTTALNTVKKGNKTPKGTARAMLSAIPGLGPKRIDSLSISIAKLATLTVDEIAALGVGPKLAATIYEALQV